MLIALTESTVSHICPQIFHVHHLKSELRKALTKPCSMSWGCHGYAALKRTSHMTSVLWLWLWEALSKKTVWCTVLPGRVC